MGLTYCGKASLQEAAGISQSLVLCIGDGKQMARSTGDSGCGTPESFGIAYINLNICTSDAAH